MKKFGGGKINEIYSGTISFADVNTMPHCLTSDMQSSLRCNQMMLYTTYNTHLRNSSTNSAFSGQKFEFGLSHPKENITTHSTDTSKEVKHKHEEVREVILEG